MPRPGEALGTIRMRAPLIAAIVGTIACQASSQISMRRAAERRVEHAESAPAREKAFLVEDAVRRQKHLAVHVHDPRFAVARRRAGRARCCNTCRRRFRRIRRRCRPGACRTPRATLRQDRAANRARVEAPDRRPRPPGSIRSARASGKTTRSRRRRRASCANASRRSRGSRAYSPLRGFVCTIATRSARAGPDSSRDARRHFHLLVARNLHAELRGADSRPDTSRSPQASDADAECA